MRFNIYLLLCFCILSHNTATAQSGCTDPAATNYNSTATTNDGSCVYPVTHNTPALKCVLSHTVTESSGLVWADGKLWSHNDSGNPAEFYSIDTADGHVLQTVVVDNYPNTDWEDITADNNYIYLGDHGNNDGTRTNLRVLKIAKADITNSAIVHVNAQAIAFSYTDQTSFAASKTHNFDCEALVSIKDSLYIFTKDRGDMKTRVYKMPKTPGTYALTPYTGYDVKGLITGADYNEATHEIILVGYMSGHTGSFLWFLDDFKGDDFFSGNKRRIEISHGNDWQTEGVAYFPGGRFVISCETSDDPASLYMDSKALTTGINNAPKTIGCTIHPNPTGGELNITMENAAAYRVMNTIGQTLLTASLVAGTNTISLKQLLPGMYHIAVTTANGETATAKFEKR